MSELRSRMMELNRTLRERRRGIPFPHTPLPALSVYESIINQYQDFRVTVQHYFQGNGLSPNPADGGLVSDGFGTHRIGISQSHESICEKLRTLDLTDPLYVKLLIDSESTSTYKQSRWPSKELITKMTITIIQQQGNELSTPAYNRGIHDQLLSNAEHSNGIFARLKAEQVEDFKSQRLAAFKTFQCAWMDEVKRIIYSNN